MVNRMYSNLNKRSNGQMNANVGNMNSIFEQFAAAKHNFALQLTSPGKN